MTKEELEKKIKQLQEAVTTYEAWVERHKAHAQNYANAVIKELKTIEQLKQQLADLDKTPWERLEPGVYLGQCNSSSGYQKRIFVKTRNLNKLSRCFSEDGEELSSGVMLQSYVDDGTYCNIKPLSEALGSVTHVKAQPFPDVTEEE